MKNINQELERLQLISDFLKGKLSNQQIKKLEERLENEPVLQEELYRHKTLIKLLKKKQERDIAALLEHKNDIDYMKKERIYRRSQLRQELEKIKEQKTEQQEDWERKVAQSNQPSIYKMAAIFFGAIAIGASVFVVATQFIDTNEKKIQAEITPADIKTELKSENILDEPKENVLQSPKKKRNTDKPSKKNNSIQKKEKLIAFQPIEAYEKKLNQNTRSAIKLKSPHTNIENYTKNLTFDWNGTSEEEIYLEIINSKKEIKTYQNLKTPFNLKDQFERGIYYWILQTDSEVIKRGKFLVK